MSKCKYCGVEILDVAEKCPLCQGVLDIEGEGQKTYPDAKIERKHVHFAFRILLFLSLISGIICGAVNYYATPKANWSLIVIASLAYGMWMLYVLMKENAGYRLRIFSAVFGAVVLVILLDYLTGFGGWSLDYVLPGATIFVDVALLLLMMINRRNWQSYMILQFLMVLIGLVPIVLHAKGIVQNEIFAVISLLITVILFLGSVVLGGRTAMNELKRRFHV